MKATQAKMMEESERDANEKKTRSSQTKKDAASVSWMQFGYEKSDFSMWSFYINSLFTELTEKCDLW